MQALDKTATVLGLMNKYNINGPRYTSYPTALEFDQSFTEAHLIQAVTKSTNRDLSLYLHIPFCHKLCYYCGCNKIVTRQQHKADIYLDYLIKEMRFRAQEFRQHRVVQVHLGGGTPSFLNASQFTRLVAALKANFDFANDLEMSIEIDPREIELELLDHLRQLGFTRLSFGVQDTNIEVQEAINRVQDLDFIKALINRARELAFQSINLDVVYGLPFQTEARFTRTLNDIIDCKPDRISLFSYAHLPSRFAAQRKIKDHWLPTAETKMALMFSAIDFLTEQGYVAIGMDHFALPHDELSTAQKAGKLHRNFQGYTTRAECDLLGLGVSSISAVGASFSQNVKALNDYYQRLDEQLSPLEKGLVLTLDDKIRADLIKQLMCNFTLDIGQFETKWDLNFTEYFTSELLKIVPFINDQMVTLTGNSITVTTRGKLFVRTICMTFDKYMANQLSKQRFSRVI